MSITDLAAEHASNTVYQAIQHAITRTERSEQARQRRIGVSELGHCRRKMQFNMDDTPQSDTTDLTAAWAGTIMGDSIEKQINIDHPDWITQAELKFPIPSGGWLPGHSDIIIPTSAATEDMPQAIIDLKGKAEIDTAKRYGPTLQQKFQVHAYAHAAIDKGHLDPSEPLVVGLVFYDRTGKDAHPHSVFWEYDPAVIDEIDDWINDVVTAVEHGTEAQRDKDYSFCQRFCEFFTVCRTNEHDTPDETITDEETNRAADLYAEANQMEREAKKLKKSAKETLNGITGTTNNFTISETTVGSTWVDAHERPGYTRLNIRPRK